MLKESKGFASGGDIRLDTDGRVLIVGGGWELERVVMGREIAAVGGPKTRSPDGNGVDDREEWKRRRQLRRAGNIDEQRLMPTARWKTMEAREDDLSGVVAMEIRQTHARKGRSEMEQAETVRREKNPTESYKRIEYCRIVSQSRVRVMESYNRSWRINDESTCHRASGID